MKKALRWFLILSAIVIIFTLGFKAATWLTMAGTWFHSFQYGYGWQSFSSSIGLGISVLTVLGKVILIFIGWQMWRKSKSVGKFVGAILFMTATLSLLPSIFAIPLLLVAVFIGYKICKKNRTKLKANNDSNSTIHQQNNYANILDQWEKSVR